MDELVPEVEVVTTTRVSCQGQGGALGHPIVWYQIPEDKGWVDCGYCDKRFILAGSKAEQSEQK